MHAYYMTFQQKTKAHCPLNASLCVCVCVCVCVYVPSFDQHVWYPSDSSSTRQPSLLTAAFPQPCLTARPLTEPPRGKRESRALTIYHAWALLAIQCQHKGVCVRRGEWWSWHVAKPCWRNKGRLMSTPEAPESLCTSFTPLKGYLELLINRMSMLYSHIKGIITLELQENYNIS